MYDLHSVRKDNRLGIGGAQFVVTDRRDRSNRIAIVTSAAIVAGLPGFTDCDAGLCVR